MNIRFIVPYIGEWPWWMPYYLVSCAHNRGVSWLLIGDKKPQDLLPENVSFVQMDLAGINELASKKLGRKVDIGKPYKLCDLRPAYGAVFEDYLQGYDFWGHTDLDIVYGDIMGFLPNDTLRDYDVITPYSTSCGHFQLYRNTAIVNRLYEKADDLDAMLTGDEYRLYDHVKAADMLKACKWYHIPDYQAELKKDKVFLGATIMAGGNIVYEEITGSEVYYWENGKAFQCNAGRQREFIYLHFMGLKNNWPNKAVSADPDEACTVMLIYQDGIYMVSKDKMHALINAKRRYALPVLMKHSLSRAIFSLKKALSLNYKDQH